MTTKENILEFLNTHVASTYDELHSLYGRNDPDFDKTLDEMVQDKQLTRSYGSRIEWLPPERHKEAQIFARIKPLASQGKARHAMNLARCDLTFALSYLTHPATRGRLEQSIRLLTDALDDHEEFTKLQARWDEESKSTEPHPFTSLDKTKVMERHLENREERIRSE